MEVNHLKLCRTEDVYFLLLKLCQQYYFFIMLGEGTPHPLFYVIFFNPTVKRKKKFYRKEV